MAQSSSATERHARRLQLSGSSFSTSLSTAVSDGLAHRAAPLVLSVRRSSGGSSSRVRRSSTSPVPFPAEQRTLPAELNLVSVKKYGAKGDGVTDDTAAIRRALADGRARSGDYTGRPKTLFFPAGTYVVSDTLSWIGNSMTLQGAGRGTTILRLKDRASGFNSANTPKSVLSSPAGNMSHRQFIRDLTVNTGRNNAGAIAINFVANNVGAIARVNIQSGDGLGHSGLNMSRQWPGPLMVNHVAIDGFARGIYTKHAEYGPTFEHITLTNQTFAGILNEGNTLAIRHLTSTNSVPAIRNTESFGSVILLNGTLRGGSSATSAIVNEGHLYARSVTTQGYRSAIHNRGTTVSGTSVSEYVSGRRVSLFQSPQRSLNLPIEETPSYEDTDLTRWARFTPSHYGDTSTLQSVLNSGKSTIYFAPGNYFSYRRRVVTVPATVRRIVGFQSVVNSGPDKGGIVFRVEGNSPHPLIIEQFNYGVSVEHASSRTVVLKNGSYRYTDSPQPGNLFLEDVGLDALNINYPRNVWARQLNIEGQQTKINNNGGNLWILGLKTEGAGTVIRTAQGGRTELLGTVIYPARSLTSAEQQLPAFVTDEASQSLIYSLSSYLPNGLHRIQVRERRDGVIRNLMLDQMDGMRMPLYSGFKS